MLNSPWNVIAKYNNIALIDLIIYGTLAGLYLTTQSVSKSNAILNIIKKTTTSSSPQHPSNGDASVSLEMLLKLTIYQLHPSVCDN